MPYGEAVLNNPSKIYAEGLQKFDPLILNSYIKIPYGEAVLNNPQQIYAEGLHIFLPINDSNKLFGEAVYEI